MKRGAQDGAVYYRPTPDSTTDTPSQMEGLEMPDTRRRYEPTVRITRLPDVFDQLFRERLVAPVRFERPRPTGFRRTASNLLETPDCYIVQVLLPYTNVSTLEVLVHGTEINLKGKTEFPSIENATYLWHGLPDGEFSETFMLPAEVNSEKAEAGYDRGILEITLPKAEHVKVKTVKVVTPTVK